MNRRKERSDTFKNGKGEDEKKQGMNECTVEWK